MRIYILIKFLLGVVVPNYVTTNDIIKLELKATKCEQTCDVYTDNKTCPSSIRVNGKEESPKKDGFNIVVIDNKSGRRQKASFRWNSSPRAESVDKDFLNYFARIKRSSVVVIVFQKMCSYIPGTWHRFLRENPQMKIVDLKESNFIAIIVACKFSCPKTTRGSIPYSYSGPHSETEHSVKISYRLGTASIYPNGNGENKNGDDSGISYVTIIVPLAALLVGVVILLACCYCHDTYKRTIEQNQQALHYEGRSRDELTENRTNTNSCASTMDQHNEPLYEELGPSTKPEIKSENLYVDCNDFKRPPIDAFDRQALMAYDEPRTTVHPSAPPMYLHYE